MRELHIVNGINIIQNQVFDGSQSGGTDYYQFNMMTGNRVRYAPSAVVPKQVSIGWDETIYNVDFTIARYNGTTDMVPGTTFTIFAPLGRLS